MLVRLDSKESKTYCGTQLFKFIALGTQSKPAFIKLAQVDNDESLGIK